MPLHQTRRGTATGSLAAAAGLLALALADLELHAEQAGGAPVLGYTGEVSYAPGDTLTFHLSAPDGTGGLELRIARHGREVVEVARVSGVQAGDHAMPEDASSHGCRWPAAAELTVPAGWRSGYYEAVPWAEGSGAPVGDPLRFIVRPAEPGRDGAVLLHLATNTENAYCNTGGFSLYAYNGRDGVQGHRVSFERPMSGFAHTWELPFIRWAEGHGYLLDYCANLDLELQPDLLDHYRLVVSVGHDEYWSKGMRDAVEAFLARGGNAAFFTGNTCCWQVRPEDGGKALVSWKQRPDLDPYFTDPSKHAELSTLWSHHLVGRPETAMLGVGFLWGGYHRSHGQHMEGSGAFTVHRPDHWVFDGTALARGDGFGGADTIVGYECDGSELEWRDGLPFPTGRDGTPPDATVLATAPATWHPDDSEWYERWEKGRTGNACLTVRESAERSGGTVFAAGTTDWSHGLAGGDPVVARITRNVLDRLSRFEPEEPRDAGTSGAMLVPRPGFSVEEVAAEPLVLDPVAFDWDDHGRLWVAEMGDYPESVSGGRIVRLADRDGDGRYDHRDVVLDDVDFPAGVMTWRDGVLVTAAPEIFFAADRDGDGMAEVRETLFTGFGEGNQQHRVNSPRHMLDGGVSIANGDSGGSVRSVATGQVLELGARDLRIDPDTGAMAYLTGRTQFGRNRDDWGNWFGCNNPNPGWHYVFEERYLAGGGLATGEVLRRDLTGSRDVFPVSLPLLHSIDIVEPAPGQPGRFTAACGIHILREAGWGEAFDGNAFVSDPVYNVVHRIVLHREGAGFRGRRAAGEERSEFLASRDPWFRPTEVRTGPDGALWVADMYRLVIEHPTWIPDGLKAKLDLGAGRDRGRIYRVFPSGLDPGPPPDISGLEAEGLVALLESPNGSLRDRAARKLFGSGDRSVPHRLRALATASGSPQARVQALHLLAASGGLTPSDVEAALADRHPEVRRHALRLAETVMENAPAVLTELVQDPERGDLATVFQASLSSGAWPDDRNADTALLHAVARSGGDPAILDAVLAGCTTPGRAGRLLRALVQSQGQQPAPVPAPPAGFLGRLAGASPPEELAASWDQLQRVVAGRGGSPEPADLDLAATLLNGLGGVGAQEPAQGWVRSAEELLLELDAGADHRAAAARFLAAIAAPGAPEWPAVAAGVFLDGATPEALRSELALLLGASGDAAVARALGAGMAAAPQRSRNAAARLLLQREAWLPELVAAIAGNPELARALAPDVVRRLAEAAPTGDATRVRRLLEGGRPPDRAEALDRLRPALGLAGDPGSGAAIYAERCALCHDAAGGGGHRVGPDLGTVADASAEELLVAIVDPDRAVEEAFLQRLVSTTGGQVLAGIITAESSASMTLVQLDGTATTLPSEEVAAVETLGTSPMPPGLEAGLTPQGAADLIAFVKSRQPAPKSVPGNEPTTVPVGDAAELAASTAAIYGPTLTFEAGHQNLGFWSDRDDRATWTIEVDRAGRFEVWAEVARPPDGAWQTFEIRFGHDGGFLRGRAPDTRSWDNYNRRFIGTAELPAGRSTVTVQAPGELRGYLMDLRALHLERLD